MDDVNALGDYLKARRELVQPGDVGIRVAGVRRVAGLRREEVAMLAGISSDYYLRLEQGRDRNPSVQVLEALAQVLQLDPAATDYLIRLAQEQPRKTRRPKREVVPPGILSLLDTLELPAFVEGRYFDVLASNPLAVALSPHLKVGDNRMRAFFLAEDERALYPDWDRNAAGLVAGFRTSVGTGPVDPEFVQLVGELSVASSDFRRLWARHDVRVSEGAVVRLRHPQVGDLELLREKLAIGSDGSQLLVVYHAARGSDSAGLLALLGSAAASEGAADAPVAAEQAAAPPNAEQP